MIVLAAFAFTGAGMTLGALLVWRWQGPRYTYSMPAWMSVDAGGGSRFAVGGPVRIGTEVWCVVMVEADRLLVVHKRRKQWWER